MGVSFRLADAPPALAAWHREHLERQVRLAAAQPLPLRRLPSPTALLPPPIISSVLTPRERAQAALDAKAAEGLAFVSDETGKRRPTIGMIVSVVAAYYGISRREITSNHRVSHIVRPRQIADYLARKFTALTLPQIARIIGGRHHSTVMFGIDNIYRLANDNAEIRADLAALAEIMGMKP